MDHRPFKDWLLENKHLTPAEKNQLGAHLQVCKSCKALAEVNLALQTARLETPRQGFEKRFEYRLAERKKALHRRHIWGFQVLAASVTGLLIFLLWPFLVSLIQSPVNALGSWLSSLVSTWSSFQAAFHASELVFKVVPGFVPVYVWILLIFVAGAWGLIWIFSILKLSKSLSPHR